MQSLDLKVLNDAVGWLSSGHGVSLFTVVETWGSAPRPPGALMALRDDGAVSGSVSGGCVESDLIARSKLPLETTIGVTATVPKVLTYGVSKEEATRFGLPCGGTLRLVQECLREKDWIEEVIRRTESHRLVARTLNLSNGKTVLQDAIPSQSLQFDEITMTALFGPRWRLLLIGSGQLSQVVASMASTLDFEVLVCDPREEYAYSRDDLVKMGARHIDGMPDDVVRDIKPDARTAIVALTHDPKLDDMALIEALTSDAFYVGALGSRRSQEARRARLIDHFDLTPKQVGRLHGPVGLPIRAITPAEIAVSIVAEIVQEKNSAMAIRNETASQSQPIRVAACSLENE
jgi:xanthine dehydrogenase accessory factor